MRVRSVLVAAAMALGAVASAQEISGSREIQALSDSLEPDRSQCIWFDLPWVFSGYRSMAHHDFSRDVSSPKALQPIWEELAAQQRHEQALRDRAEVMWGLIDDVPAEEVDSIVAPAAVEIPSRENLPVAFGDPVPGWLRRAMRSERIVQDAMYISMVETPRFIEFAYWDLPEPPRLPEDDYSFAGYLKRLNLPQVDVNEAVIREQQFGRYNWLHQFNVALQLSQAYVSKNWYQGGTSYFALLTNFLWDVQLNQVYHPKWMLQSTLSYKLAVNSTPEDQYHKYSVSQDLFQYNFRAGYKAANNWYYAFTTLFKTQFCCSYPSNSEQRTASFLSPGELNVGLGMTYSKESADKGLKVTVSIAPVSYNLKTCIDPKVDHAPIGVDPDRKVKNEFGSNTEVNFFARIWDNITYTTRMYLFTDYHSFQGDWENTFNFQFNRYFSTQVYAHLRYDSLADTSKAPGWHKWMLKEILSVGISYSFSTK